MPRAADQQLQERIVKAAYRLWQARGEKGLTLRAVAKQAGTTTTTVYKRFRNREALRLAVARRVEQRLVKAVTASANLQEFVQQYLGFAQTRPQEYRLLYGSAWPEIFGKGRPRPIQDWVLKQLSAQFGGEPQQYVGANLALFLAVHGAASLITSTPKNPVNPALRDACLAIFQVLLTNMNIFSPSNQPAQSALERLPLVPDQK